MEISEEPIFPGFEDGSRSCPQAYPASRRVLPGSDEARRMTVGSGRQCSMWLDASSPLGAFSRILLESSHWTSSEEYCYVWNRLDTRFALSAFQLTPLGLSTDDNGCSLWRTPNASVVTGGGQDGQKRLEAGHALQLSDQALTPKLWPTPTGNDAKASGSRNTPQSNAHGGESLTDAARGDGGKGRLWPTPQAHDAAKGNPERVGRFGTTHGGRNLNDEMATATSGSLNPRFVEELMGFRIDHTALKRSGMPSFHSRSTRSSGRSH
jgi:hypothetical protein